MKHRKIWQMLLTILLMGVMFAGCASAGTKASGKNGNTSVPQKAEDTSGAVKKEAAEKKENGENKRRNHHGKKVLVISTSMRGNSNSEKLAEACEMGKGIV